MYFIYKNSKSDPGYILGSFQTEEAANLMAAMMTSNLKLENKRRIARGKDPSYTTYEVQKIWLNANSVTHQ